MWLCGNYTEFFALGQVPYSAPNVLRRYLLDEEPGNGGKLLGVEPIRVVE
jgi:hypothetical protein